MFDVRLSGGKEGVDGEPARRTLKRTSPVLNVVRQALTAVSELPDSAATRDLRDQCLACEHIAEQWSREPPLLEEREALMKMAVALQIAIARVHRSHFALPDVREGQAIAVPGRSGGVR